MSLFGKKPQQPEPEPEPVRPLTERELLELRIAAQIDARVQHQTKKAMEWLKGED
jgi:hypothetical protein